MITAEWFEKRFVVDCAIGCWLWLHHKNWGGYGSCKAPAGKRMNAHRATYEFFRGPIPPGLDLDHLCRVRSCVNPWHLEPVTRSVNLRRGLAGHHVRARQQQKTACPKGHPFNEENTYVDTRVRYRNATGRGCKECRRQATRDWRARNKTG